MVENTENDNSSTHTKLLTGVPFTTPHGSLLTGLDMKTQLPLVPPSYAPGEGGPTGLTAELALVAATSPNPPTFSLLCPLVTSLNHLRDSDVME